MHENVKGIVLAEVILAGNYIFCPHLQKKNPIHVKITKTCQARGKIQYELLGCLGFLIPSKKPPLHLKEKFYVILKSFIFMHLLPQDTVISQNTVFSTFCIIF